MLLTVLVFLLILSVLIFVHELGHFLVAKKAGVKVEEFGFGLPPRVWGKKIGETIYSLNLLPIGGFVRLYGESEEAVGGKVDRERQFLFKSKRVRAAVTVAGVVMNFLLAIVVFSIIYTKLGIPTPTDRVRMVGVVSGSPGQIAGFKEGDILLAIDGEPIKDTAGFIHLTQENKGEEIVIEISRGAEKISLKVIPRENPPEGEGPLGVAISNIEARFYPFWEMPVRGTIEGVKESVSWAVLIVGGIGGMFYKLLTAGAVPQDVAGPVGIFQLTGQAAQMGFLTILQFLGILSINLAVVNILPIPALDGGRLLFIALEAVIRKRVSPKIEAYAHQIGMAFLLALILLITVADIRRIMDGVDLIGRLKSLLP